MAICNFSTKIEKFPCRLQVRVVSLKFTFHYYFDKVVKCGAYGVFTLGGTWTVTGTGTRTIGDNKSHSQ